ncbi:MAG: D-2-hydroxyacid dehydrogenase [Bacteroidota bacterium]
MHIVVLDGYTLNPGDLDWSPLTRLGECTIFERSAISEVVGRCTGAEIVLTNKTVLDRQTIGQLKELRYIGVLATGYNVVDVAAASERGIVVTNVPAYGTESVAQMAFGHILNLVSSVGHHAQSVREGGWSSSPDWSYRETLLIELAGLTIGIVGFGRIGQAVGRIAGAFGMKVLANETNGDIIKAHPDTVFVPVPDLLRDSDIVTLHCPLTDASRHLINRENLRRMKPGAFLINTSRGGLIDGAALADALNEGVIGGAGLDVLPVEPPPSTDPLLHARNCFITPHIAWATLASRKRLLDAAAANVEAFLAGRRVNVVSDAERRTDK